MHACTVVRGMSELATFDATRLIAHAEAGRKCVRCRADVHAFQPHECPDLTARREKQDRVIRLIEDALDETDTGTLREQAEAVYKVVRDRLPLE